MPSQGTSTVNGYETPLSSPSKRPPPPVAQPVPQVQAPPEVEYTISRIAGHRGVRGVMICARDGPIIRQTGTVFEGEQGRRYASAVKRIVDACKTSLEEVDDSGDEMKFMRLRTRRHELMITPDEHYLLVVLQDPAQ